MPHSSGTKTIAVSMAEAMQNAFVSSLKYIEELFFRGSVVNTRPKQSTLTRESAGKGSPGRACDPHADIFWRPKDIKIRIKRGSHPALSLQTVIRFGGTLADLALVLIAMMIPQL